MRLVRLGAQGHSGVPEAIETLRLAFVRSTSDDRPEAAAPEWQRLEDGAIRQVEPDQRSPEDTLCSCEVLDLQRAIAERRYFAARTVDWDRKVLRALVEEVARARRADVTMSQRKIGLIVGVRQASVSSAITRLVGMGWIQRRNTGGRGCDGDLPRTRAVGHGRISYRTRRWGGSQGPGN